MGSSFLSGSIAAPNLREKTASATLSFQFRYSFYSYVTSRDWMLFRQRAALTGRQALPVDFAVRSVFRRLLGP
jgi:hypothetical protein